MLSSVVVAVSIAVVRGDEPTAGPKSNRWLGD
jgi:hypothetical protein